MRWDLPLIGRIDEVEAMRAEAHAGNGTVVVGPAGIGKSAVLRAVRDRLATDGADTDLVECTGRAELTLQELAATERGMRRDAQAADTGRVLLVDDAHLPDDDSAELLWRLSTDSTTVIAAVRSEAPTPDRVDRLWTGGTCRRVDLGPLTERDVQHLLEQLLGGDVEDRLPRLLTERALGNALLIRELIRSGLDSGVICKRQEVWCLEGALPLGASVVDLIRAKLSELDAEQLRAAQIIAIGEPLRLTVAEAAIALPPPDALTTLETLEARQVVAATPSPAGTMLALAHPLYGEVVREGIATLRLRRLQRELLEAIEQQDEPTAHERLRQVLWRLELGAPIGTGELRAVAESARELGPATAEHLARALLAQSPSVEVAVMLAEILILQGRVAEADAVLDATEHDDLDTSERESMIYARALGRMLLGEAHDVAAMISTSVDEPSSFALQAAHAQALTLAAQFDQARAVALPVIDDVRADAAPRLLAAFTLVAGGSFCGRMDECEDILERSQAFIDSARPVLPYGPATMLVAAVIARAEGGRLDEAEALASSLYDQALAEDDEWLRPRGASGLGIVALTRGKVRTATRYLRIAVASLNRFDRHFLRYNLAWLARGAALAGFVDEARQALQAPADAPDFPLFRPDWLVAEAAVLAACGDLEGGGARALDAARLAASAGQWAVAVSAAHAAVRYISSAEAAQLARAAAARVDGALASSLGEDASARVMRDGPALMALSERFATLGALLLATDSAYAAAGALSAAGSGREAARAITRATALHRECEQAAMPWVRMRPSTNALTRREHQVALLAAGGSANAAIAAELGISVRTVQNHLASVYGKLGLNSRHALPDALFGV